MLTLLLLVILVALVFEFINGFHDTANSIATVVATKVLTPTQAVMLAAVTNLAGAFSGTAVAKTISSGLVDTGLVTISSEVLICALTGAIIWNLITWALGLPSSSSHALIGGLCGAALAAGHNNFDVLIWSKTAAVWTENKGILWKVLIPMVSSPIAGFTLGIIIMGSLMAIISGMNSAGGVLARMARPKWINAVFGKAQFCQPVTWALRMAVTMRKKPWVLSPWRFLPRTVPVRSISCRPGLSFYGRMAGKKTSMPGSSSPAL